MITVCGYSITVTADDAAIANYVERFLQENLILVEYEVERCERVYAAYETLDFPGVK